MQATQSLVEGIERHSIARNEPDWLKEYRKRNAEILSMRPLKKSHYSDLGMLDSLISVPSEPQIGIALPMEIERPGIRVLEWGTALKEMEQEIRNALEKEQTPVDQYEAFANAWFNSGFIVEVSEGVDTGKIVEWASIIERKTISKVLVFVGENIQGVQLLERMKGSGNAAFYSQTVEVRESSKASLVRLHENIDENTMLCYQQALVGKDAELLNSNGWLGGKTVKGAVVNSLIGNGSGLKQFDFLLAGSSQRFELKQSTLHIGTDTSALTVFKNVMTGRSRSTFDGMVKILSSGQRANSLLEAHSMILSNSASSNNIPGLEIEADDVKATHSATVAHADEEQIFYLQSRGITRKKAEHMIVSGFLESVLFQLPGESMQKCISALEQKFMLLNAGSAAND